MKTIMESMQKKCESAVNGLHQTMEDLKVSDNVYRKIPRIMPPLFTTNYQSTYIPIKNIGSW